MAYKRKTWTQKWAEGVAKPDLPKVLDCPEANTRFVVPNPAEVETAVRHVHKGQVATMAEIADKIAKKHQVESCCPMTTGIFAWILAHTAAEEPKGPLGNVPWWRVVKAKGELNLKYPGAPDLQRSLLESEGRKVIQKGKKFFVQGV
jgi:alkylated DNA nucleotide flippase Atl1